MNNRRNINDFKPAVFYPQLVVFRPVIEGDKVYVASPGMRVTSFCLDQETGRSYWIVKLGQRVEESTLCIYRNMVYVLSADGYVHAIE